MSDIPTIYNRKELNKFDLDLRSMVDAHYNFCLGQCNESNYNLMDCKRNCAKKIMIPFRMSIHKSRENEENDVRRCLAKSPNFPNLEQNEIINCTNISYIDRIETLAMHRAEEAIKFYEKTL